MPGEPLSPTVEAPPAQETPALETRAKTFVSVVIPCLNEAQSIEESVRRARQALEDNDLPGEVVVADNGSTDGSPELAGRAGARVVHETRRGTAVRTWPASTPRRATTSSWPTRT